MTTVNFEEKFNGCKGAFVIMRVNILSDFLCAHNCWIWSPLLIWVVGKTQSQTRLRLRAHFRIDEFNLGQLIARKTLNFLWSLGSADWRTWVQSIDIVAEQLQNVSGRSHHCWVISYCEAPLSRKSLQRAKMTYCLESHSYLSFCPSHGPRLQQFIMFMLITLLAGISYFQPIPARALWCLGNFTDRESENENEVKYLECFIFS